MKKQKTPPPIKEIKLESHFIKSNYFRVIHVDGAYGGVTPTLDIHMAVYNERAPIPDLIVNKVSSETGLGDEIRREMKKGIVREVEVGLIMSASVAKSVIAWLQEKVDTIENIKVPASSTLSDDEATGEAGTEISDTDPEVAE